MVYKAISLKQPWANLVASGKKTIETRKWSTSYRGDLVVCSSKQPMIEPFGVALCMVELVRIEKMKQEDEKDACCKRYDHAYSWFLSNLRPINKQVPVKGWVGLFDLELPDEVGFIS